MVMGFSEAHLKICVHAIRRLVCQKALLSATRQSGEKDRAWCIFVQVVNTDKVVELAVEVWDTCWTFTAE